MKRLIITHANCVDGCSCRAIFEEKYKNDAYYLEVDHIDVDSKYPEKYEAFMKVISQIKYGEVFMADITLKEDIIEYLMNNNNELNIIDHHDTALPLINKLRDLKSKNPSLKLNITFSDDNSESGALLTWKHIHPNIEPPEMIKYVSDGDLWKFKYGNITNYFYAGLLDNTLPKYITKDYWINLLTNKEELSNIIQRGSIIYDKYIEEVKSYIPVAQKINLNNAEGYIVNAPLKYKSELGNFLAQKNQTFGIVWEERPDGIIACSIRSNKPFEVDGIAKAYGGGGHKQAAAFRFNNYEEFKEKILSNIIINQNNFKNKL